MFGRAAHSQHYLPVFDDHFFDSVYYPSPDHVAGRPYGLWVQRQQ